MLTFCMMECRYCDILCIKMKYIGLSSFIHNICIFYKHNKI